jgi:hypothetical protein
MTIVKIDKENKDRLARLAADCHIGVTFYTIENNDLLILAEIDTSNGQILFGLGKMLGHDITNDSWSEGLRKITP